MVSMIELDYNQLWRKGGLFFEICALDFLPDRASCSSRHDFDSGNQYFSIFVGNGIGPETFAPVRFAVSTISSTDLSRIRCS